jgi:hypothetical protein
MRHQLGLTAGALSFVLLLGVTACTMQGPSRSDPPPPPSKPLPISAFTVRFTAAGSQTHPPAKKTETRPYKIVLHLGNQPPQVRRDTKPTRPYVTIGTLRFSKNWYTGKNLDDLCEKYAPEVGGNAVLTWTIYQTTAAVLPGVGNLFHAAYEAEVIWYTDK